MRLKWSVGNGVRLKWCWNGVRGELDLIGVSGEKVIVERIFIRIRHVTDLNKNENRLPLFQKNEVKMVIILGLISKKQIYSCTILEKWKIESLWNRHEILYYFCFYISDIFLFQYATLHLKSDCFKIGCFTIINKKYFS